MEVLKVGYKAGGTVWFDFIKQKYIYAKKKDWKDIHTNIHKFTQFISTSGCLDY